MSGDLFPTLEHQPGETPISFVSRLAAFHRVRAREFCKDMGLAFQAIVDGCGRSLAGLASLAGSGAAALRVEAIRKTGERTYEHKGEALLRTTLRRSRVMICAACVGEDIAAGGAKTSAYGRTIWTLDPIRTCPAHGWALVEVVGSTGFATLHDFAANVAPALERLSELAAAAKPRRPSDLETYLLDRLEGRPRPDAAWLNALAWHVASDVCHLLGAVSLHGRDARLGKFGDDDWHASGDAGFAVASGDASGVTEMLHELDTSYPGTAFSNEGPQAVFGTLFKRLAFGTDRSLDPLRAILHVYAADTWPVGPDNKMFGRPFGSRRKHSIRSASLEYGLHPKRLRKILEAAGAVQPGDTDERTLFDAEKYKGLLETSVTALSLREAETYLNAGRVQTRLLMQSGFIQPFVVVEAVKTGEFNFASGALDRFLRLLLRRAVPMEKEEDGAYDIPSAAKRTNCGAAEVVMLLMWGDLDWVGRHADQSGYLSVRVRVSDMKDRLHGQRPEGRTAHEVEKILGTRSATVSALIATKHLTTIRTTNPVNRCPLFLVPDESVALFQRTYVSLFGLARERGMHFRKVKTDLEAAGVQPALRPDEFEATFYRRSDLPN